jgi:hypothetical protein
MLRVDQLKKSWSVGSAGESRIPGLAHWNPKSRKVEGVGTSSCIHSLLLLAVSLCTFTPPSSYFADDETTFKDFLSETSCGSYF